jgi:hypothetical protein
MVKIDNLAIRILGERGIADSQAMRFKLESKKENGKIIKQYAVFENKLNMYEKMQSLWNPAIRYDKIRFSPEDAIETPTGYLMFINYSTNTQIPIPLSKDWTATVNNWIKREKASLDALKSGDTTIDALAKATEGSVNQAMTMGLVAAAVLLIGLLVVAYSMQSIAAPLDTGIHALNTNITNLGGIVSQLSGIAGGGATAKP